MTYNHAPYIEDAMRGFCMQQTSFPFVAIIVDDASTDGEPEVILKYLDAHFDMPNARRWETADALFVEARHKENQNCWFAVVLLKYNFWQAKKDKNPLIAEWLDTAKYIALCEGDDYWIVADKLQRQVDFLEKHGDYGLTYTKAMVYSERKKEMVGFWGGEATIQNVLTGASPIPTLSTCFRKDIYEECGKARSVEPSWVLGDVPLWLYFLKYSRIYFEPQVTGVYRELIESASHSEDFHKHTHFVHGAFTCRQYYAAKYCGKEKAKEVFVIKIKNLLDLSFRNDKPLKQNLLKEMRTNGVYDMKLKLFVVMSKSRLGRWLVNMQRKIRKY